MKTQSLNRLYQRLIRTLCWLGALAAVCMLAGCHLSMRSSPDYANTAFSVNVRGQIGRTAADGYTGDTSLTGECYTGKSINLTARLSIGAPATKTGTPDQTARSLCITFSTPPALAGVTVTKTIHPDGQQTVQITRDGITFSCESTAFDGLLRIAEALLPIGDVTSISPVKDGQYTVTVKTPVAEQILTFLDGDVLPCHVSMTDDHGWIRLSITSKT